MNFPEDRDRDFERKEAELENKARELRLRELELEINQQEPPVYETRKHQGDNQIASFGKKLVRYAKFFSFIVLGIALTKLGLIIGMWLAQLTVLTILGFISYKIFLDRQD